MSAAAVIRAGGDGLFFAIIVIASIIAQIVKASRKAPKPPAGPESGFPPPVSEAEQEIQDFLRKISGEAQTREPPPRASAPPVPSGPAASAPRRAVRAARRPATTAASARSRLARPVEPPRIPVQAPEAPPPAKVPVRQPQDIKSPGCGESARDPAESEAPRIAVHPVAQTQQVHSEAAARIHSELANRSSVQRAWLLREVLGQPVALRPYSGPAL